MFHSVILFTLDNVNALELKFHAYDWALSDPLEHLDLDGWGFLSGKII